MKIGLFDSGVGGVSVLHEAMRALRKPEYLYMADVRNAPYGTKSAEEVSRYAKEAVSFLLAQGAEAVVVACNTATSAAIEALRNMCDVPVIGMEPAVKPALSRKDTSFDTRVLVLATPLTLRETKLKHLIERYDDAHRVDLLALPDLVRFAEEGRFQDSEVLSYLEEAFGETDCSRVGVVVPGCTHFHFFVPQLKTFFPDDCVFVDGLDGTIRRIASLTGLTCLAPEERHLEENDTKRVRYFLSEKEVLDRKERARFDALHERLIQIGEEG